MPRVSGFIDTSGGVGAPIVRSLVFLPRFGAGGFVDFLVDTGASKTALHPYDWTLFVPPDRWTDWTVTESLRGIGGSRQYAEEEAGLIFVDEDGNRFASQQMSILVGLLTVEDLSIPVPSVLGMDIMSKGSIAIDQHSVTLDLPGYPLLNE